MPPAEAALVVDRQSGVAVRLTTDASDPLHLGRARIVFRPVAFEVLGSHRSCTVLSVVGDGPACVYAHLGSASPGRRIWTLDSPDSPCRGGIFRGWSTRHQRSSGGSE